MAAILRTPSLRSPSTVFLCSLTVSDLLVGLPMQPFFTATSFNSGGYLLQSYNMSSSCCGVSLCTMTSISVDRYLALRCHMRYPNLMTSKRGALHIALFIWFIFPLLSCIYFGDKNVFFFATIALIVLCILISTFSYI